MSSRRLEIAPTDEELDMAESLVDALLAGTDEELEQNIADWKSANMPAVRDLLEQHFEVMLENLVAKTDTESTRERESARINREIPRLDITLRVTYQGIDGNRMVRPTD